MRQCLTPLVLLLSPAVAAAHNGSHTDTQGIEALMHQLLQHAPALIACVAAGALGYALLRRIIDRRTLARGRGCRASIRNISK